jgi:hypothetical protein
MRLLPNGMPQTLANQSIDSLALMKHAVANPDVLPTVFELFREEYSPLTTLLNTKNMKSKNLYEGFNSSNYRVTKSNVVQYAIKHSDKVKLYIRTGPNGVTFSCPAYPNEPGKNGSVVYMWADKNWAGPKEVLEFNDNKTLGYVIDDQTPVEDGGSWRYMIKLMTKDPEEFFNPSLFEDGAEFTSVYTAYEHDWSETGNEKYTFDGWGTAYMTLQRLKYSISGTAAAMETDKVWAMHNGQATWLSHAQYKMMRRAAQYHEYATIFGKGTVGVDGKVFLHDKQNREIMTGDGILNQGDGAYEYPYNEPTLEMLESIMEDIDLRAGTNGKIEVAFLGGNKLINAFSRLMLKNGFKTQNNNVVGDGAEKGVNNDYSYYEFGGVRIVPQRWRWLDNEERPHKLLTDGTKKGAWDGIFIPLGITDQGEKQIELIQLRPMKEGTVSGIDKGGPMATSVDGSSYHVLFQTGVICRAKPAYMFRHYNA